MEESPDVHSVRVKVEDYCRRYCISPPFSVSGLYDIHNDWKTKIFPQAGDCGCYVYYSENADLLYIGKASLNTNLGYRMGSYFRLDKVTKRRFAHGNWTAQPAYLQTIKVHHPYEAPSLEEFLILELQPSENLRKGRRPSS